MSKLQRCCWQSQVTVARSPNALATVIQPSTRLVLRFQSHHSHCSSWIASQAGLLDIHVMLHRPTNHSAFSSASAFNCPPPPVVWMGWAMEPPSAFADNRETPLSAEVWCVFRWCHDHAFEVHVQFGSQKRFWLHLTSKYTCIPCFFCFTLKTVTTVTSL